MSTLTLPGPKNTAQNILGHNRKPTQTGPSDNCNADLVASDMSQFHADRDCCQVENIAAHHSSLIDTQSTEASVWAASKNSVCWRRVSFAVTTPPIPTICTQPQNFNICDWCVRNRGLWLGNVHHDEKTCPYFARHNMSYTDAEKKDGCFQCRLEGLDFAHRTLTQDCPLWIRWLELTASDSDCSDSDCSENASEFSDQNNSDPPESVASSGGLSVHECMSGGPAGLDFSTAQKKYDAEKGDQYVPETAPPNSVVSVQHRLESPRPSVSRGFKIVGAKYGQRIHCRGRKSPMNTCPSPQPELQNSSGWSFQNIGQKIVWQFFIAVVFNISLLWDFRPQWVRLCDHSGPFSRGGGEMVHFKIALSLNSVMAQPSGPRGMTNIMDAFSTGKKPHAPPIKCLKSFRG